MEMIQRLKEETRDLHEQVEEQNLARLIMDYSIDLNTYKQLLLQNYIAYQATENAIQNYLADYSGKKHIQLKQDLVHLGVSPERHSKNIIFECHSKAEALGAAYVVEGSTLGGMLLAKNIDKCKHLVSIDRHHFFNGNKDNLKDWKHFKKELEQYTFSNAEENEAVEKARDTFRFFQEVFNREIILT
ncbi:biliverdin-producing heme oxygenase [Salinimicrobium xinjiangense]|uniref:biliverdin-producing heme oxygenase n=1 Tax=Salinimicrobium xinjiangense TaxID=438596 RepID=UPI00055EDD0C|nr:biliverdin-producing heme oxygenase [Salinimicrobium xinjiangense]